MNKLNYMLIFVLLCFLDMKAEPFSGVNEVYLAKVEIEGSPAIIDLSGNYVVRPGIYEAIYFDRFSEGLCPVKRNGKEGFIDVYGIEVIPCIWRWVWKFEKGELIVLNIYDKIVAFNENVAVVKQNNRHGTINTYGELIIQIQYFPESITGKFNGGRLGERKRITEGIKAGYINKEGELVIPYVFDKVYPFMKVSFN